MTDALGRLTLNRREFLKGCCATAVVGATAGPTMLFSNAAVAGSNTYDTVVQVFLRGGIDGLNLVVPVSGADRGYYEAARPNLKIAVSGDFSAIPLTLAGGAATGFGLHPSAVGLHELWDQSKLAIVHSCGLLTALTRSHFDAQLYLDLGTPGLHGSPTGWITRAWATQPGATGLETMPQLAVNNRAPANMLGSVSSLAMASPADFALNSGAYQWQMTRANSPVGLVGLNETMQQVWAGRTDIEHSGARADQSLRVIAQQPYAALPAGWPTSNFARQLWTVAQSIRFNLGLRYAALDLGGWDTHEGQGTAGAGYNFYQNKIVELSQALTAFYNELAAGGEASRVTVVVQSEFGRRVAANASGGTDHGYGNPMLVLGGPVNGRRFYGTFAGLSSAVLQPYFGDVPVTTDYRRVMSELLIRRMGNNKIGSVFPGYANYAPLGIVQGTDLAPVYATAGGAMADASMAHLPDNVQPRYGESLDEPLEPAASKMPAWRTRGKIDRKLVRRGL